MVAKRWRGALSNLHPHAVHYWPGGQSPSTGTRVSLRSKSPRIMRSPASDWRAKLTVRLAADSARLDILGKQLIEVTLKINENQIRFNEAIRAVKMLQPLPAQ